MKKLLLTLTALLTLCNVTSCGQKVGSNVLYSISGGNWKALCCHESGLDDKIAYFYDKDTSIVYMYFPISSVLTPYLNSKGEPMTLSEFNQVHMLVYHNTTI